MTGVGGGDGVNKNTKEWGPSRGGGAPQKGFRDHHYRLKQRSAALKKNTSQGTGPLGKRGKTFYPGTKGGLWGRKIRYYTTNVQNTFPGQTTKGVGKIKRPTLSTWGLGV